MIKFNHPEHTMLDNDKLIAITDIRGNAVPDKFVKSLLWQLRLSRIHSQEAYKIEEKLSQKTTLNHKIVNEFLYHYWAHFEACLTTVNSLPEFLAQWLNVIAMDSALPESEVTLKKVCKLFNIGSKFIGIKDRFQNLEESMSYKFVTAFSNVHKHRHMTEVYFAVSLSLSKVLCDRGFWIEQFSYNNSRFDKITTANALVHASKVGEWVKDVLCDIQKRV